MKSADGNIYRFNLSFKKNSEEAERAGEFLSRLGHKKSSVIIAALNEFQDNHPDIFQDMQVNVSLSPRYDLDDIKRMIAELVTAKVNEIADKIPASSDATGMIEDEVSEGVNTMLENLGVFDF